MRLSVVLRLLGWAVAALIVIYVGANLGTSLLELQSTELPVHPDWGMIVLSGATFLLAHSVLVQTWRSVLACWDDHLPFWGAARVWSVSNLFRYIPGSVWQIGAMSRMSSDIGISPVTAPAAALLSTLVNVIVGFVVALISGRALLDAMRPGWSTLATIIAAVAAIGLLSAPFAIPWIAPRIGRLTGREIKTTLPKRAVVYSLVGNLIAWLLYGAGFQMLVAGIFGNAAGGYSKYLAAYTISYLFGYLAFFAPAGAGVRELAMLEVLKNAGLAAAPQAALITISSRVWLTLLEVTPAVFFWAHHRWMRHHSTTTDPSDVPT